MPFKTSGTANYEHLDRWLMVSPRKAGSPIEPRRHRFSVGTGFGPG